MKMKALLLMSCLATVFFAGSLYAQQEGTDYVQQKMAINFAKMTSILNHLLIDENYEVIIQEANAIEEHAKWMKKRIPELRKDNEFFEGYVLQLESNATNLKAIAKRIYKERGLGNKSSEFLRAQASAHFGQMVTMCVSCHNTSRAK